MRKYLVCSASIVNASGLSLCPRCAPYPLPPTPLQDWFTVYEHNRRPSCTVSDLVMGNEYMFRVFSENLCGLSDEVGFSKNTAVIAKTGMPRRPHSYSPTPLLQSYTTPKILHHSYSPTPLLQSYTTPTVLHHS